MPGREGSFAERVATELLRLVEVQAQMRDNITALTRHHEMLGHQCTVLRAWQIAAGQEQDACADPAQGAQEGTSPSVTPH